MGGVHKFPFVQDLYWKGGWNCSELNPKHPEHQQEIIQTQQNSVPVLCVLINVTNPEFIYSSSNGVAMVTDGRN